MAFSDDGGGFAFECADAKMSIGASTWATRFATVEIVILTRNLPDTDYIIRILDKRPRDIWIVAHVDFVAQARALKAARPWLHIAVHRDIGAKAVLVVPDTLWLSSSDFGKAGEQ